MDVFFRIDHTWVVVGGNGNTLSDSVNNYAWARSAFSGEEKKDDGRLSRQVGLYCI